MTNTKKPEPKVTATARWGAPEREEFRDADGWTVTLRYEVHRLTVPFYKSSGHNGAKPDAAEVLNCLVSDSLLYENARDFEDFCSELGLDTDSRKAELNYRECGKIAGRLRKLL